MTSVCGQAQHAIVCGGLDDELREHAERCAECSFFLRLSRSMSGAWPPKAEPSGSPLGDALSSALVAACAAKEPLLGRWRLEARLGHGGQAEVYRAVDLEVDQPVAVKVVRLPADVDPGVREVALARRVAHAGICRVFHTERFGELRLIVMELIDGPTLADAAQPPRDTALAQLRAICDAVAAAHSAGVLHLDLKPGNIMLRGGSIPVITDFGLARASSTGTVAHGGTVGYMAPEQLRGERVDARTDVYALGLVGRHLLGKRAGRLDRVLRRATAGDPSDRYSDAGALARALGRRSRALALAAGSTAMLGLIGAGVLALAPPPHGPRAAWREDLWGRDLVPDDAWNVALNRAGTGLPRVAAEPVSACARRHAELVDGIAQYDSWEHGVAFPAPFDVCIGLDAVAPKGLCGVREPTWKLCRHRSSPPSEKFDLTVADFDRMPPDQRARMGEVGEIEPALPCGERELVVELDREWPVIAVRHWHHGFEQTPRAFRVEVDAGGRWQLAYATQQNIEGIHKEQQATGVVGGSAPVTAQFPAMTTPRVRLVIDTCSTDPPGGQGWLYEIEVFAVPSRWRAWWMRILG
jgi:hypothetical protein